MSSLNEHPSAISFTRGQTIRQAFEVAAYEALWTRFPSVAKMADLFRQHSHALPSEVAERLGLASEIEAIRRALPAILPFTDYRALFFRDFDYPNSLRSAKHPIEVLYYQGDLSLLSSPCVSVVGARKASPEGVSRTRKIAKLLSGNGYTIMSGLAEGIDTAAHAAALEVGGKTVAVIGTPLNEHYPRQNSEIQKRLAKEHLVVSQVPFFLTSQKDWRENRRFFPERNKTMSALSLATVIVEASDTSGTLFQARAAIAQGRKLFILNSCFERGLKWPELYLRKGAIRVVDGLEVLRALDAGSKLE